MRRLLALLVLPLLLVACDSGTTEVSSIVITRAQVTAVSFDASDSDDQWDDLYLAFRVGGTDVRPTTRNEADRVRSADLVYDFDFGDDIEIVDLGQELAIQAYNREGTRTADVLIGATTAVSIQSIADSEVGSREFSSADGSLRVRLNFEYER